MQMRKAFFLAACLIFLSGLIASSSLAYDTADYYPTDQGDWWLYSNTANNFPTPYETIIRVGETESVTYPDGSIYQGFRYYNPHAKSLNEPYVGDQYNVNRNTAAGVEQIEYASVRFGIHQLFGSIGSSSPTGPYLSIPASLNMGDNYRVEYTSYTYNTSGTLELKIDEYENTTLNGVVSTSVPAGNFSDTVESFTDHNFGSDTRYLAKGVGVVKDIHTNKADGTITTSVLERYGITASTVGYNSGSGLGGLTLIGADTGTIEIAEFPPSGSNMLHLISPEGLPIGFGLNDTLSDDFAIKFDYAGMQKGKLNLLLDGQLLNSIEFNNENAGPLYQFYEFFHTQDFGLDPNTTHQFSFILESSQDPELFFDNLSISNLRENNVSVVPEPASMLLFGIGGAAMAFIRRKKKIA